MDFAQEQNEALIDLLNLVKTTDNKIALAESSFIEKFALQLTWTSGESVYTYIDKSISKINEYKRSEYPNVIQELAKILNTDDIRQVATKVASELCNIDGDRDPRESDMLTMMHGAFKK